MIFEHFLDGGKERLEIEWEREIITRRKQNEKSCLNRNKVRSFAHIPVADCVVECPLGSRVTSQPA